MSKRNNRQQRVIIIPLLLVLMTIWLPACSSPAGRVPAFKHIVWIIFENRDYASVIGNAQMPFLNELAEENVLLTHYTAIRHPSLPNYLALIGGDTFSISKNCTDCFLDQESLPDLLEESGRSWKTYQEDMPAPCTAGNIGQYVQRHNPFIYFDAIRLDPARCQRSVVPLTALDADLAAGSLPDFAFIVPNLCHSGHDCDSAVVDGWLSEVVNRLQAAPALAEDSLIVVTYDESKTKGWVERLLGHAGGQVVTLMISPLARPAFQDDTPYTHYSLLKTLMVAWDLPDLHNTRSAKPITRVWK